MKGIRKFACLLALALVVSAALPSMAPAFQQRTGDNITVSDNVSDDLYLFGSNIEVSGEVTGDVVAFGQSIVISGNVTGDVITAGSTIRVSGPVDGSVRAAGSDLEIAGTVGEDVMLAGGTLRVTREGSVGRDAVVAGGIVNLGGEVQRNVVAGAGTMTISSAVGGDVGADVENLTVTNEGSIGGDLTYYSDNEANISGQVAGETERFEPRVQRGRELDAAATATLAVIGWIRSLIGMALFAVLVLIALRGFGPLAADEILARPLPSIGIGFAVLVLAVPVSVFVLIAGIFIGGWWIAFVLLALAWILALVGMIIGALALGRWVLRRFLDSMPHPIWSTLLGLLIIWIVGIIPFVGWLAGFVAMVFGMGAVIVAAYYGRPSMPARMETAPPPPPPAPEVPQSEPGPGTTKPLS